MKHVRPLLWKISQKTTRHDMRPHKLLSIYIDYVKPGRVIGCVWDLFPST